MTGHDHEFASSLNLFVGTLLKRLEQGHQDYGDKSLGLTPGALLDEIEEELVDVCGWAVILFHRLRRMREALDSGSDSAL